MKNWFYEKKEKFELWGKQNPRKLIFYTVGIMFISLVLNIIRDIYFPPKYNNLGFGSIPVLFQDTPEIEKIKADSKQKLYKMEAMSKELEILKQKRESNLLTANDSIRLDYLYEQYKTVIDE